MDCNADIIKHYSEFWGGFTEHKFNRGPINELPDNFKILKFAPTSKRNMWTYATCGMSARLDKNAIEIHIFSPVEYDFLIELLTIIAHYHITGGNLGVGHTVNLDGPLLENLQSSSRKIQFLWLIPITVSEVNYKKQNGLEALEQKFDEAYFNYLDPYRKSIV